MGGGMKGGGGITMSSLSFDTTRQTIQLHFQHHHYVNIASCTAKQQRSTSRETQFYISELGLTSKSMSLFPCTPLNAQNYTTLWFSLSLFWETENMKQVFDIHLHL